MTSVTENRPLARPQTEIFINGGGVKSEYGAPGVFWTFSRCRSQNTKAIMRETPTMSKAIMSEEKEGVN